MKNRLYALLVSLFAIFMFIACQRDVNTLVSQEPANTENSKNSPVIETLAVPYSITLTGPTLVNGNWQWIWAVKNNNPGNGNNGTFQDISHWGIIFSSCFNMSAIKSAGYSSNGTSWTNFTPQLKVDPSSCINQPVLKFDYGTNGSANSYYRLILNANYPVAVASGYYKSGRKTGCGPISFNGIGCIIPD